MTLENDIINRLYDEVLIFCKKEGLVDQLQKSLVVPEGDRFSNREIDNTGLDVLDAVHCLVDKKRTIMLLAAVYEQTTKGNVVIEAGLGTGILSFMANLRGAKVYGFEINPSVYELANKIKKHLIEKRIITNDIEFIKADARNIKLEVKADIIISENIYTGMFFEKQIDIVSGLLPYLKKKGHLIPCGMKSSFLLSYIDFPKRIASKKFHVLSEINVQPKYLTDQIIYDLLSFAGVKKSGVQFKKEIKLNRNGEINSILVCSDVSLPSGKVIDRFDTEFMNNDVVFFLGNPFFVKKGDRVNVEICYLYGSNPEEAYISVKKL